MKHRPFASVLREHKIDFKRKDLKIFQINLGKLCNQACHHCHVEAGPHRTEIMTREIMDACLRAIDGTQIKTVDLTGGAPELNPHFEYFVEQLKSRSLHIIDRCNLTVFFEKGKAHLPQFFADHNIEVTASLPCYSAENVNKQRGGGVFQKSIEALKILNSLGYGDPENDLILNLVYNPVGAHLPPEQKKLEQDYKRELWEHFKIRFNQLYTITNMPIKRYTEYLRRNGEYDKYMSLLVNAFNPEAARNVMCYELISVGWDGTLYDCDFNQMLEIPLISENHSIVDFKLDSVVGSEIVSDSHCFGCTAGSGSSCSGALGA